MYINNLKIELNPRLDKDEEVYYIGRLKFPGSINLNDGVTFLIFLSEDGDEELQIAVNDKENSTYSRCSVRGNKMKIKLDRRLDKDDRVFYICKVKHFGSIQCDSEEVCFLAFTSKEGNEELQITGEIVNNENFQTKSYKNIEVIRR